ncbi:MAG: SDR family oxidoreductase [Bacteroidales bacterium]|nr:SDR family oxidoreductase [Bacteroidales bacterium]
MRILLTGASGYIGKRLVRVLLEMGYDVTCCVRDLERVSLPESISSKVDFLEIDFLYPIDPNSLPSNIDGAFYLIHSMSQSIKNFSDMEELAATNFRDYMNHIGTKHVVYLSGIVNSEDLSKHLRSRKNVENILAGGNYNYTVLRAGIIVGSGSASFEIIRDLTEKLPIMLAPRWALTKSQPIAIRNVLAFLSRTIFCEECYNKRYDIGGPDILTYKDMLKRYAKVRALKRIIITVPFISRKISSYWLFFVTPVSFKLASTLVESMKVEVIGKSNDLTSRFGIELLSYEEAINIAFTRIEQNVVVSSWKDSMISGRLNKEVHEFIQVPKYGIYKDVQEEKIDNLEDAMNRIWSIGGETGWYYATWIWNLRGFLDKLAGGIGIRRGRTNLNEIHAGDALDFWRVLLADREKRRLLLYAEMRLPGEAWLEFSISENGILKQEAIYRPKGIYGRFYWYMLMPFHYFIFKGMARVVARGRTTIEIVMKS